jgi:hypothetical protein
VSGLFEHVGDCGAVRVGGALSSILVRHTSKVSRVSTAMGQAISRAQGNHAVGNLAPGGG